MRVSGCSAVSGKGKAVSKLGSRKVFRKTACENGRETASTGRPTTYTYDQLGRLVKMVNPVNGGTRLLWDEYYQYDVNSNMVAKLVGVVNGSGNITEGSVTAFEYDSLSRLTKVKYEYSASTWPIASISISNDSVSYQYYGGSSFKTQMVDASGTSQYTYDTQGRLSTYTPPQPANYEIDYAYNAANEKTSVIVKHNGANAYQTLYTYFKNGWLKQVKGQAWDSGNWSDITQTDYTYDASGRLTASNNANGSGVQTEFTHNAWDEVKRIRHWNSTKTIEFYGLQYIRDGAGNPVALDYSGSWRPEHARGVRETFAYDDISRLIEDTVGSHAPTSWTYDWVGNRDPSSNSYNQADELNSGSGYEYDKLGNLEYKPSSTSPARTQFYYNGANLLRQGDYVWSGGTITTNLTWDADQRMVKWQCGDNYRQSIYDPTAATPSVLVVITSTGGVTCYFREPDGALAGSYDGSQAAYYHFDALGSTVMLSGGTGTPVNAFDYTPWGTLNYRYADAGHYQYVGKYGYYDNEPDSDAALTGLLRLGVRFYDPQIGRFTQRDPAGDGLNPHIYVHNEPTVMVDPTGEIAWWLVCVFPCGGAVGIPAAIVAGCYSGGARGDVLKECFKEVWDEYGDKCETATQICVTCILGAYAKPGPGKITPPMPPRYRPGRPRHIRPR